MNAIDPGALRAVPSDELETLRALLKEAAYVVSPGLKPPQAPTLPGQSLHERITRALKPKPAPLPYTANRCTVRDVNGVVLFGVSGPDEESAATAEFIARACSTHAALVEAVRASLGTGLAIGRAKAWDQLLETASGEPHNV